MTESDIFGISFGSTITRSGVSGIGIRLKNTVIVCGPKDRRLTEKKADFFEEFTRSIWLEFYSNMTIGSFENSNW